MFSVSTYQTSAMAQTQTHDKFRLLLFSTQPSDLIDFNFD